MKNKITKILKQTVLLVSILGLLFSFKEVFKMADNPMYNIGKDLQKFANSAPVILNNKVNQIDQANKDRQLNSYNNASNFYNTYYANASNRAINNKTSTGGSSVGRRTSRTTPSSNATVSRNDL